MPAGIPSRAPPRHLTPINSIPWQRRRPGQASALWNRKGGGAAESAAPVSEAAARDQPSSPPPPIQPSTTPRPVVVRLPVLPGDTVKTLARRHGLTLAKVRAANGGSDKLPPAGGWLPFTAPAVLGPRATRAAADLAASLARGVPPPPQPVPWTASLVRSVRDTGKLGVALALAAAGWAFWGGVEGRVARKLAARAADVQDRTARAAEVEAAVASASATASPGRTEEDAAFDAAMDGAAAAAAAGAGAAKKYTAADPAAPPPQPAWAGPASPKVWRLGVAGDLGSQAVVPLLRVEEGGERSQQPAWLCFEAGEDAAAWGAWLRDGPVGQGRGGRGGLPPPTTATAPLDLSLAALAGGRALALVPASARLAARLASEPGFAADQGAVLAWLSGSAHPDLGGVGTLSPADRARLEGLVAAAAAAAAAMEAEGRSAEERGGVVDVRADAVTPPPPPPPARDWWRAPDSGLDLAWVPVLGLGDGGGRGFLMVSAPAPTAIGFAAQEDAASLARAWLACGGAEAAGTTVEAVIGLSPAEFAAHVDAGGAGGAVLRPGELVVEAGWSADELTDALVKAAAGQGG